MEYQDRLKDRFGQAGTQRC